MTPARILWLMFAYLWLSIAAGWIKLPLPYPAVKQYAHPVPSYIYPWKQQPLDKGRFKIRTQLNATRLFEGQVRGSESITMTADGRFVMLDKYGAVLEATVGASGELQLSPQPLAHLGPGRPLGAKFDAHGNLIICDAFKGLIMLEAGTRRVVLLTNRISPSSPLEPDTPLTYTNDLDIAEDGTIYFTDSTDVPPHRNAQHVNTVTHIVTIRGRSGYYDTVKGWAIGMLQGLPQGRLVAYFPGNRSTHVVAEGLHYPNGVALAADESFVALAETDRLRVLRVFLPPHPRAGSREVLIDGLPGTPDGVSRAADGSFWVSLVSNIPGYTKWFGSPLVRGVLGHVPENWRPQVPSWGAVLKVSAASGAVQQWLVDLTGRTASKIPSAHEEGGRLFFGNLAGDYVSYVELADLPPDADEEE